MPVRPYHRVRVGKNTGVIVTAGKRQRAGCLNILYWITIGWVLAPTWWLLKNGWALFVRLLNHLSGQIGKSMNTKSEVKSQKTVFYAFAALFASVVCCGVSIGLISLNADDENLTTTSTEESLPVERNEEIDISTPTTEPTNTATVQPTKTVQPTNTARPSKSLMPSKALTITQPAAPTNSPRPVPTKTKSPTANAPCSCSSNYNCTDFSTHSQAQRCFDYCGGSKTNNFSGLDRDHDGIACESLP